MMTKVSQHEWVSSAVKLKNISYTSCCCLEIERHDVLWRWRDMILYGDRETLYCMEIERHDVVWR